MIKPVHTDLKLTALLLCLLFSGLQGRETSDKEAIKVRNSTFEVLKQVSGSTAAEGRIMLSVTTHQDHGWIDEIRKCAVMRDTLWITPYLQRLSTDPGFQMDIEQVSVIREYLERHPDKKDEINKRLKEGRMLIGGSYTQPYEEMYMSESLARQFYLGKWWLKKEFDGYDATLYYNSDVPGRTLQMPQLLAKAGIRNMFISRHGKGVFEWYGPDSSAVTTYSPGHYIDFYHILAKENEEAIAALAREVLYWTEGYNDRHGQQTAVPAVLNYEFIWDQAPVMNLDPFIKLWNNMEKVENEHGEQIRVRLPQIRYATLDEFFDRIRSSSVQLPSISGERPNVWTYIHGPSHHWALDHSRKADILLPAAEKLAVANALASGSFTSYPSEQLDRAWEAKIYPDHGWGGKEGRSTDDYFLSLFKEAHESAGWLAEGSLRSLASKVNVEKEQGIPIMVFNSVGRERSGVAGFQWRFNPREARSVRVLNRNGNPVPHQLASVKRDPQGYLRSAGIRFLAESVPSIGFDTYYLACSEEESPGADLSFNERFENSHYKVRFANGGIASLVDKEMDKELLHTAVFLAGEVFTMGSEGEGAGAFADIQQPDMDGFDRTAHHPAGWDITDNGPLFTTFRSHQKIRNAEVEILVTFYHSIKKIDFHAELTSWDGTMYREYRMAFPLNITDGQVAYEVPFGVVEVGRDEIRGAAGNIYHTPSEDIHPRGIGNWIGASGEGFGVTLSSSVAVADYMDPTGSGSKNTILQPLLLASRKSCHMEGNDYHQTGHHKYLFSLTSHEPGWRYGIHDGRENNEPFLVVAGAERAAQTPLPETESFLNVAQENIIITAMKRSLEDDGVVIRFYNYDSRESKVDLTLWKGFGSAVRTNLIEEPEEPLLIEENRIQMKAGPYEICTIKVNRPIF